MATNLWTDVEALARLADISRTIENPLLGHAALEEDLAAFAGDAGSPVEIGAVELPARVVSGDFHATFMVSDETLALAIADISGKGVPAGMLRAFSASMVRSVSSFSASPDAVLTRVNEMICGARLEALYLTIFLGWLNLKTGRLVYANAGHPCPFRVSRDGTVRPFGEVTGPILGILENVSFGSVEEGLDPGDVIALYTDGVTEATDATGSFIGARGLASVLARHAAEPVSAICEKVAGMVDAGGGPRHDDATLLAVRWS